MTHNDLIDASSYPSVPELLAPAGNRDSLLAALNAGADAIYLGAEGFNARRGAANFSLEELAWACDLAHCAGRRIYLTLNTMVKPTETGEALALAYQAWELGVDALIVADLGLTARIAHELPGFELHASTQMGIHSSEALRAVAHLGVRRATLARELALTELAEIAAAGKDAGVDLEVFVHGALCVCYSGQCLFSSMVGGRSANRGMCAQPCRLPYRLIDSSTGRAATTDGEHLLSPADLAALPLLPELAQIGIASLKIEGRMKSAAYAATTVRAYREALDALAENSARAGLAEADGAGEMDTAGTAHAVGAAQFSSPGGVPHRGGSAGSGEEGSPPTLPNSLSEVFSRGFTTAYLAGERGNAMMSYRRPNNRGVLAGRVAAIIDGMVEVETSLPLTRGDLLEFRTGRGQTTVTLGDFRLEGSRLRLRVPAPVGKGDRVFRVRSAALLEEAAETYDNTVFAGNRGLVGLNAHLRLRIGELLELGFSVVETSATNAGADADTSGSGGSDIAEDARAAATVHITTHAARATTATPASVTLTGPVIEPARSRALSAEDVREHVGRVGGTPFSILNWDIELDEGVGLGFSVLHKLRAEALDALSESLLEPWRLRARTPLPTVSARPALAPARKGMPRVAAIVSDANAAKLARKAGAEHLYLNPWFASDITTAKSASAAVASHGGSSALLLPTITHDRNLAILAPLLAPLVRGDSKASLVVNNLAELALAQQAKAPFEAGAALGICNADTLALCAREGATQSWVSPELTCEDIRVLSRTAALPLTLVVSGRQELMTTEHCLLMAKGPCDQNCAACTRRKAEHLLEDRKGYRFPVRTDCFGRGHLFNSVPLDLISSLPELLAAGISTFVVDGTLMNATSLKEEVARAHRALELALSNGASLSKREGRTTGHLYRGVL